MNNLVWSVCVPQLCDADDLNKLFKILNLKFDDNNCKTKNDIPNFTVDDVLARYNHLMRKSQLLI